VEQNRELKMNPYRYGPLIFDKVIKNMQWKKKSIIKNWLFGKLDFQLQKNEMGPLFHTSYKNQVKMDCT
jgi:hypothetical protein